MCDEFIEICEKLESAVECLHDTKLHSYVAHSFQERQERPHLCLDYYVRATSYE